MKNRLRWFEHTSIEKICGFYGNASKSDGKKSNKKKIYKEYKKIYYKDFNINHLNRSIILYKILV